MPAIELPVEAVTDWLLRRNTGEPHAILAGSESHRRRSNPAAPDRAAEPFLTLIQHAQTEYYAWIDSRVDSLAVLIATRGRATALLIRRGDLVTLGPATPNQSLVSHLPDMPPAQGASISVPATDYTPLDAGILRRPGSARSHEARRLDDLLRHPRTGGARLYAATRDHTGHRHRAPDWLTILDLDSGRWLLYLTGTASTRAINAVPATPALITAKLTALIHPTTHR